MGNSQSKPGRPVGRPKTGGRKKGTANKVTKDLRQWVTKFINNKTDRLERDWKKLTPRERVFMFERLLKYALPTLSNTKLETNLEDLSEEQLLNIIENLKSEHQKNSTDE